MKTHLLNITLTRLLVRVLRFASLFVPPAVFERIIISRTDHQKSNVSKTFTQSYPV